MIDAHAIKVNAKVGMVASNLSLTKVKTLANILGSQGFYSLLKIIRRLELLDDLPLGEGFIPP